MQGDSGLRIRHAISAKSHTAAASSGAIDTRGYSAAHVIVNLGTGSAGFKKDVIVKESPSTTAASFSAVAGTTFTQLATGISHSTQIGTIDLRKRKRYIQVHLVATNSTATLASAVVVLAEAKVLPATGYTGSEAFSV